MSNFMINSYRYESASVNGLLTDLEAYRKLDSDATDAHASYDGTNTNGTWDTTTYKLGTASWEGNSTNTYITMGDVLDQDGSSAFSFSLWFNQDNTTDYDMIFGKQITSGNYNGFILWKDNQNRLRFDIVSTTTNKIDVYDNGTNLSTGSFQHIVVTYDGSKDSSGLNLYLNDSLVSVTVQTNSLTGSITTTAPLNIGSRNNGNLPTDGHLDEVGFRSKELSSTDVTNLYNSGSGLAYSSFD